MSTFQRFTVPTGTMRKPPRGMFGYKSFPDIKVLEVGDLGQMECELTVVEEGFETDEYGNQIKKVFLRVNGGKLINKRRNSRA